MVSVRRVVVPVLLFLIALPVLAAPRSTRPPKNLHLVGDHWTPYNPPDPASFPPGSKVHIIVRGDTLWDLAAKFYGNAYLWPQIWEANTYITDSHWIYPGDPLLIQGEAGAGAGGEAGGAMAGSTTGTGEAGEQESAGDTTSAATPAGPVALGDESVIFCFGYLGDPNESLPARVISYEDAELKYIPGVMRQEIGVADLDVLYVSGSAAAGLVAGETYMVVTPSKLVRHPKTGRVVGRHYDYRGRVKVLCINDDRATVMVTSTCKDIHVGDRLKPVPSIPIPLARLTPLPDFCDPSSGKASGFIVNAKDFEFSIGQGGAVQVNLGKDDLIQPGDFLTVFRESKVRGNPRIVLGEIGIITTEARTATGMIMQMRHYMKVGDRVEVK